MGFHVGMLSLLPFGAWAQAPLGQTFIVDPSTVPGVEVAGRGTGRYPPNIDSILGSVRSPDTNAWLSFSVTLSNGTSQGIVAVAARWTVTDQSDVETDEILSREFFRTNFQIDPGKTVVLLPSWMLAASQRGIRTSMGRGDYQPSELQSFQGARSVRVTLDGIVFASGQFVGPNTAREYEQLQAESSAPYNLATAVLARRNAGESAANIVEWLQQTASVQPAGAYLQARDWSAAVTARVARRYVGTYNSGGETGLFALAAQQAQGRLMVFK